MKNTANGFCASWLLGNTSPGLNNNYIINGTNADDYIGVPKASQTATVACSSKTWSLTAIPNIGGRFLDIHGLLGADVLQNGLNSGSWLFGDDGGDSLVLMSSDGMIFGGNGNDLLRSSSGANLKR